MPRMGESRRTYGQWWDSDEPRVRVAIADLERVSRAAYASVGASAEDAAFLTATNLDKAIQGDHARGVAKIPGLIAAARSTSFSSRKMSIIARPAAQDAGCAE